MSLLCGCSGTLNKDNALNSEFLSSRAVLPRNSENELELVTMELEELGYVLVDSPKGKRMTTTLNNQVILASGFSERSPAQKVRTLRHELVHAKQWRRYGVAGFAGKYAIETQRWVLEMHGYRQSIRDSCSMGLSRKSISEYIGKVSKSFSSSYKMKSIQSNIVEESTVEVLFNELDSWEGCLEQD